jgi:hypothetical protein
MSIKFSPNVQDKRPLPPEYLGLQTPPERAENAEARAENAEERAQQEASARQNAEERAQQEMIARQNAEAELTNALAEIERLRVEKND